MTEKNESQVQSSGKLKKEKRKGKDKSKKENKSKKDGKSKKEDKSKKEEIKSKQEIKRKLPYRCYNHHFKEVEFRWPSGPSEVLIAGSFMDWSAKAKMTRDASGFKIRFVLPKGHHEFKFYVNNVCCLSKNYRKCKNSIGRESNFIHID